MSPGLASLTAHHRRSGSCSIAGCWSPFAGPTWHWCSDSRRCLREADSVASRKLKRRGCRGGDSIAPATAVGSRGTAPRHHLSGDMRECRCPHGQSSDRPWDRRSPRVQLVEKVLDPRARAIARRSSQRGKVSTRSFPRWCSHRTRPSGRESGRGWPYGRTWRVPGRPCSADSRKDCPSGRAPKHLRMLGRWKDHE